MKGELETKSGRGRLDGGYYCSLRNRYGEGGGAVEMLRCSGFL